jgi:hypothetical protein
MILKFNFKCDNAIGWHIIGDIDEHVHYLNLSLTRDELGKQIDNQNTSMTFLSEPIDKLFDSKKYPKKHIVKVSYRKGDNYRTIITNMTCYLLNDNGQTIEKIN